MVKFETKFNGNVSRELSVRSMKKLWWVYAFFSALFIFIGVLNLNSMIFGIAMIDMIFGIAMIVFGVLFAPLCIMLTRLLQKKVDKSMSVMSEETYEIYTFDENFFTIVQEKGESYRSETRADYTYFNKVEENDTHYFLYLSSMQCHVIPKNSITEGTLEEFNKILAENLGLRFKRKKI